MKIAIKYAVMVRVDYVGAIFIASSTTTTYCMKNMDIRYKYINKYVEDRVEIVFKSAENDSNILTRNLSVELHEKHSKKKVGEKP